MPPPTWPPLLRPALARGFRFQAIPAPRLWFLRPDPWPGRPASRAANRATDFRQAKLLFLDFTKGGAELRRVLAQVQPVEESVRCFQPDAEPLRDLPLLAALFFFHLAVVRNHLRAAFPEPRNLHHTFHGGFLAVRAESTQQLVQARQAHFGVLQGAEVQN